MNKMNGLSDANVRVEKMSLDSQGVWTIIRALAVPVNREWPSGRHPLHDLPVYLSRVAVPATEAGEPDVTVVLELDRRRLVRTVGHRRGRPAPQRHACWDAAALDGQRMTVRR